MAREPRGASSPPAVEEQAVTDPEDQGQDELEYTAGCYESDQGTGSRPIRPRELSNADDRRARSDWCDWCGHRAPLVDGRERPSLRLRSRRRLGAESFDLSSGNYRLRLVASHRVPSGRRGTDGTHTGTRHRQHSNRRPERRRWPDQDPRATGNERRRHPGIHALLDRVLVADPLLRSELAQLRREHRRSCVGWFVRNQRAQLRQNGGGAVSCLLEREPVSGTTDTPSPVTPASRWRR